MASALISASTREAFLEYFVNIELRRIQTAFDGAGVRCDRSWTPPYGGQRKSLVQQYFRTVTWSEEAAVAPVLAVFENEVADLRAPAGVHGQFDDQANADARNKEGDRLLYWLDRDGYDFRNNRLIRRADFHAAPALLATAALLEGPHLSEQIERIRESIEDDPALAIGSAKELIEGVCHTILAHLGQAIPATPDIPTLTKATMKGLRLVADDVSDATKGADSIRRILQSLGSMGQQLAELRNLYGTGHGKGAARKGLQARHARLAVNASSAVALFLAETYAAQERSPSASATSEPVPAIAIEATAPTATR